MRTTIVILVIITSLCCGFAAAQGDPGTPVPQSGDTGKNVIKTGGSREGNRLSDGRMVGTLEGEKPAMQADLEALRQQLSERRTVIVRQIAATHKSGRAAEERLVAELKQINERLATVEANPLGGEEGQRSMWRELHAAGVKSESYLAQHYGQTPAPTEYQPAKEPEKGGATMPLSLQIVLGVVALGAATVGIIALCNGARRMFLRDPNREPAALAPAPASVGRREIVEETARGDYSREIVVSEATATVEALASAERVRAVMDLFVARATTRRGEAPPTPPATPRDLGMITVVVRHGEPPVAPATTAPKEEGDTAKDDTAKAKDDTAKVGKKK